MLNQVPGHGCCVWGLLQDQQRAYEREGRCTQVAAQAAVCFFARATSPPLTLTLIPSSSTYRYVSPQRHVAPRHENPALVQGEEVRRLRSDPALQLQLPAVLPPSFKIHSRFCCKIATGTSRVCWCLAALPTTMRWRRARSSMTCA
jgi:hypothetical protein